MNVVKATRRFEEWLGRRIRIVKKDLHLKHVAMKSDAFRFFRATYYRWAQVWPEVCPELAKAPHVLAVGDLHVENFGTWRDIEGRLVWGVNDFDEAYFLAYANDLVRLAVSAHLAAEAGHLPLDRKDICDAILDGYQTSLRQGGKPFLLGENHVWLRNVAEGELRDPVVFWKKMDALHTLKGRAPVSAIEAIEHLMPAHDLDYRIVHRVAGLGSLGHERYVAIAAWCGAKIAREGKALASSACHWAEQQDGPSEILYQAILSHSVRCPDPFVQLRGRWIVRRLSPHCSRIELSQIKAQGIEMRLLHAMGWETANIHLGARSTAKTILRHLGKQKGRWLHTASEEMLSAVQEDWKVWKKDGYDGYR
ncbi:MAG TPA: DUF2252 family protein [Candidatus Eisenbacteria bacterium]|nr:DUF2252 family protein [Candidatus Eisenbacteria bacterium]